MWTAAAFIVIVAAQSPAGDVELLDASEENPSIVVRNGYLSATFDLMCPRISSLQGAASGDGAYGANMIVETTGIRIEVQPFDDAGCVSNMPRSCGGEGASGAGGGGLGLDTMPVFDCPYSNTPPRSSGREGMYSYCRSYQRVHPHPLRSSLRGGAC